MIELPLKMPVTVFVRIKGEKGERELLGVLDTGASHVIIDPQDALKLGYMFVMPSPTEPTQSLAVTVGGVIEGPTIVLEEIRLGDTAVKDIEAFVCNVPEQSGVDVILGGNFLKNFTITMDYKRGILRMEPI